MSIRVIVVDDEPLGRRGIVSRLKKRREMEVVAECANGRDAIEAIRDHAPDLVFLDVQMPGIDGFEVLDEMPEGEKPHVIFVTAFDRHALRAFDAHALDYLMKPIDDDRFAEAVDRAVLLIRRERVVVERYPIRSKGRVELVRHADIDWAESEGDYVRIHAGKKTWLVRDTMSKLERDLGSCRFLRVHRSALVAIDRVQELRSFETGDCAAVLRDGTEVRMGRSYRGAVDRLTGGV